MSIQAWPLPVRMCVVVPREDGTYQAYCIACHWKATPLRSNRAAENRARHHSCRTRKDEE